MRPTPISRDREAAVRKALVLAFPGATYLAISEATGIPTTAIEKLFAGLAARPTFERIEAWVKANCKTGEL